MADPALASVIKQVESGGNPKRIRYEPGVFGWNLDIYGRRQIVSNIARINQCSFDTAHVLFSTSFGLYQLLGVNVWTVGNIDVDEFDYRSSTDLQDASFAAMLAAKGIDFTLADMLANQVKMDRWVTVWNGGGNNADYEAKIRRFAAA